MEKLHFVADIFIILGNIATIVIAVVVYGKWGAKKEKEERISKII